jgi:hypothetical protein
MEWRTTAAYSALQFKLFHYRFLGAQLRAQRDLPVEQRRSVSHEQSLSTQSARFFKFFGLGLMVIGLCGELHYQL